MPTIIAHHDVDDTEHWLASPKREEFFGPLGVTNLRTFTDPQNPTARRADGRRAGPGRPDGRYADRRRRGRDAARRRPLRFVGVPGRVLVARARFAWLVACSRPWCWLSSSPLPALLGPRFPAGTERSSTSGSARALSGRLTATSVRAVDSRTGRIAVLRDCPLLTAPVSHTDCAVSAPRYSPDGLRIAFPTLQFAPGSSGQPPGPDSPRWHRTAPASRSTPPPGGSMGACVVAGRGSIARPAPAGCRGRLGRVRHLPHLARGKRAEPSHPQGRPNARLVVYRADRVHPMPKPVLSLRDLPDTPRRHPAQAHLPRRLSPVMVAAWEEAGLRPHRPQPARHREAGHLHRPTRRPPATSADIPRRDQPRLVSGWPVDRLRSRRRPLRRSHHRPRPPPPGGCAAAGAREPVCGVARLAASAAQVGADGNRGGAVGVLGACGPERVRRWRAWRRRSPGSRSSHGMRPTRRLVRRSVRPPSS